MKATLTRRGFLLGLPAAAAGDWPAASLRERESSRAALDAVFGYIQGTAAHGGLLVVRQGRLLYERYYGLGHREATPNLASVGKSITSVAVGILLEQHRARFPLGLDQKVSTPEFLPAAAFPLPDPGRAEIKLGHLLAMSAGIRGNNPCQISGQPVDISPAGPDGWEAMVDEVAFGKRDAGRLSTVSLWCEPGGGYSYATSSIHLASVVLRTVAGMELAHYVARHLAEPLGWSGWGYGYRNRPLAHTPGGGGICLRAADLASFAYLLLRQGRWGSRQIVPEDYIRRCSQASPYNPHYPYSLQFDVNSTGHLSGAPRDAYWKSGSGGHAFYIVPSLDLVAVKLGGRDEQYDPANTGLAPSPNAGAPPAGAWKASVEQGVAVRETLRRLVAAARA